MIFIDTNVFMYAAGKTHPNKQKCVNFLKKIAKSPSANKYCINTEVLQEILHRYKSIKIPLVGFELFDAILNLQLEIHSIELGDLKIARQLMFKHQQLVTRDAVHAAFCIRKDIKNIVSYDSDFDLINEVKRIEPA